jgi:hypothetical protein
MGWKSGAAAVGTLDVTCLGWFTCSNAAFAAPAKNITVVGSNSGTTITTGSKLTILGDTCEPSSGTAAGELDLCAGSTYIFRVTGATAPATSAAAVPGTLGTGAFTIGSLPTCNSGLTGATAYVTNAQTTPTYLGAVSTTGAVTAPVFCNGSGWVYH